ncbi:MAG: hypothetical protein NTV52_15900 [Acidobacteria bacterium]|nr:hypothetical protein [Acidobacteriota bacterium]
MRLETLAESSEAVEVEEDQVRELGYGGVKLVEAVVVRDRRGKIGEADVGAAGEDPVEGAVERDAADEGLGLGVRTIEAQRAMRRSWWRSSRSVGLAEERAIL